MFGGDNVSNKQLNNLMKGYKMIELKHKIEKCYWNNAPDTYRGRVIVFEKGMRLWSISTNIDRLTKAACLDDIQDLKADIREKNIV